ncbi:disintegrin and metalloproteinase domain-containing protein 26A-like [Sigmodon hispidus]
MAMSLQLCLWMLLLLSAWSPMGHSKYSSPPEVVIPLKVTDPTRHDIYPDWLFYSLRFGGERHIITMKPTKSFISRNFLLLTYSDQGGLIEEQPSVQNDCYYHGDIDGDPESLVTINTCFGTLQGILEIHGTSYEIMPKTQTSTFEHLVYKIDTEDSETFSMRCGLTEEEIARQKKIQESEDSTLMQSHYEDWWTHHKYIEYYVVVDNKRYVHNNNNVTKCMQEMLEIIFGINTYYLHIDIEVLLSALEIWTQKNHVNVTETIDEVLSKFCIWKIRNIDPNIRNDIVHLFARQGYSMYLGLAYVGTVCTRVNCAVNSFMTDSTKDMAFIIAHEMGHNLGMDHDKKYCTCGFRSCIMAPAKSNSHRFSNCSYEEMYSVINRKTCLYNIPGTVVRVNLTICGNYLIEEGEQCDCGSYESCQIDPCCSEDCVFKSNAQCAFGLCCKDCKFIPMGTVCREKKNECDLPEWCNGTSAQCPEDVYIENGSPCMGGGYCYNKECNNREEHCQRLFGKSAKSADKTCYIEMNKQGDRFGNCGNDSITFKTCDNDDVLCGRIQCENVEKLPQRRNHETVHWTHFNNVTCWSMDYHFGIDIEDSGAVRDGTACGPDSICIGRKCVTNSGLLSKCLAQCNKQGVCNNKHHCHCDDQWEPPDCLLSGFGGSVDSGPPPRRMSKGTKIMLNFLIFFLFLLFFLIFLITNRKLHHELEEHLESEAQSELEPGPISVTEPTYSSKNEDKSKLEKSKKSI